MFTEKYNLSPYLLSSLFTKELRHHTISHFACDNRHYRSGNSLLHIAVNATANICRTMSYGTLTREKSGLVVFHIRFFYTVTFFPF